jgi:renalase
MTACRIAIIGAGMAGLSCGQALQQAGAQVQVLEKSRGAAGRMATRRGEGWQCDHGAQYFTARDPDFRNEVDRWARAGAAALWQPRLKSFDGRQWHHPQSALERFVGTPHMTAPARLLAADLPLTLQVTITGLARNPDGWMLTTDNGPIAQRFDAVVVAVPSGQVIPLLQGVAPRLAGVAAAAEMRGRWALMMQFDAPLALDFDAAFINHGPLAWVARDSSKPGRSGAETWLLHANAEWSQDRFDDDPEDVTAALLRAFAALGGPAPQAHATHRWRYADAASALTVGCAWDSVAGVGLCGDWLNGGKVEGAWLSGRAMARRVSGFFERGEHAADFG